MLAKDLKPNRMEALKRVASDFADERPNDRIGLVVYASEAYTKHRLPAIKEWCWRPLKA
jgi:Ca-activated chloride channel family protein